MTRKIEDLEQEMGKTKKFDGALHRTFIPEYKGTANGSPEGQETQIEGGKETPQATADKLKWQGDIGEGVAIQVASEKLNLMPDPRFDPPYHGLDGVYEDGNGCLVLVEAKLDKRGIAALHGNQMQVDWVERRAKLMQMEGSKQYTPGNAEIGAEIEKTGPENIRRVVIATDPSTLETKAYEGQPDGSWQQIGTWSAFEFEQPHFL